MLEAFMDITISITNDMISIAQKEVEVFACLRLSSLKDPRELGKAVLETYIKASKQTPTNRGTNAVQQKTLPKAAPEIDYWAVDEFAAQNQISVATVKRMCATGRLRAHKVVGRWRIDRDQTSVSG